MRNRSYHVINFDGAIFEGGDGRLYAVRYGSSDVYRIDGTKLRWAFALPKGCVYDSYGFVGYDYVLARVPGNDDSVDKWKVRVVSSDQVYRFYQHNPAFYGFNAKHKILLVNRSPDRIDYTNLQTMEMSATTLDQMAQINVDKLLIANYRDGIIQTRYLTAPDDIVSTVDIAGLHLCEPVFYYPIAPNIIALLGWAHDSDENRLFIVRNDRVVFQMPMIDVIGAESMEKRFLIYGRLPKNRRPSSVILYGNLDTNRFCILPNIFDAKLISYGIVVEPRSMSGYCIVPSKHLEHKTLNIMKFNPCDSSALVVV